MITWTGPFHSVLIRMIFFYPYLIGSHLDLIFCCGPRKHWDPAAFFYRILRVGSASGSSILSYVDSHLRDTKDLTPLVDFYEIYLCFPFLICSGKESPRIGVQKAKAHY